MIIAQHWLIYGAGALAAYVIGSTPFGVILARARGVDLRACGSGNVGATNVARVLGRRWGVLCFALDVAKGFVPVLAAGWLLRRGGLTTGEQLAWLAVAFGAIAGHVFSFYLRFRGGKGVATSLGVLLGVWPYFTLPGLAAFAVWIVVTGLSRYVSLGSIVAAASFPVLFVLDCLRADRPLGEVLPLLIFATVMAALVIYRHRTNIARLLRGEEHRIGSGGTPRN